MPGDMNCDGATDFDDIERFVLALLDAPAAALSCPCCSLLRGDLDANGSVTTADLQPFTDTVLSGL
jgi:hypothetical protein